MDFDILADHSVKIKEIEKRDNYWDFARELKMTMIPIEISALGTIPKSLVRGLEELEIGGRA